MTRTKRQIPSVSARTKTVEDNSENGPIIGYTNYPSNDTHPANKWRLAQDTRIPELGDWETRKGCDFYSVPIGESSFYSEASTAGASTVAISSQNQHAQLIPSFTGDPISMLKIKVSDPDSSLGVIAVKLYEDDGGSPGALIGSSTVNPIEVSASEVYADVRFIEAPSYTGSVWAIFDLQDDHTGSFYLSTTTNSSLAYSSTDSGQTWSAESYSLNIEVFTATSGGVKGKPFRSTTTDGTRTTYFAHGSSLYTVDDSDGSTTAVVTGLDASAEVYRYAFVQDQLYYVNGEQKPRYYSAGGSDVEISDAEAPVASNIIEHKGLIFLMDSADRTRISWSNFADYDEFTSTDFTYVDAPKKSDFLTAFAKLGNLVIFSRNNKFILYGSSNATFQLGEALGQKGTFTQESVAYDANYAYFASDDGIYRFDGSQDKLISVDILEEYIALINKESIVLELHENRLYVWYTPNGENENTNCFVYNFNLEVWESNDTKTFIGGAFARFDTEDLFLQSSNRVGAVYYAERDSNIYNNLGSPLDFELRTSYMSMGKPRQNKEIRQWISTLETGGSGYKIQLGYAVDLIDAPIFQSYLLSTNAPKWDDGISAWDSGISYDGGSRTIDIESSVAGCHKRIQLRTRHNAAYEPVRWLGHTIRSHIMRLR